jgi:hypothetical protein
MWAFITSFHLSGWASKLALNPTRGALSEYAGLTPHLVVPVGSARRADSRASSRAIWPSVIKCADELMIRRSGLTSIPFLSSSSISLITTAGLITIPLPRGQIVRSWTIPDGTKCNLKISGPMVTVCPALSPPPNLATISASAASRSVI